MDSSDRSSPSVPRTPLRKAFRRIAPRQVSASVLLLACAAAVAVVGYTAWDIADERERTIERAFVDAEIASVALAEHAAQTMSLATGLIDTTEDIVRERGGPEKLNATMRNTFARELYGVEGAFETLWILKTDGSVLASSAAVTTPLPPAVIEQIARDLAKPGNPVSTNFSTPFRSPFSNELLIAVYRGYFEPDGLSHAAIAATIRLSHFQSAYERIRGGSQDSATLALYGLDGYLLARTPAPLYGPVGTQMANSGENVRKAIASPRGRISVYSARDQVDRMAVMRQVGDYPFAAVASVSRDEVLSSWRSRAIEQMVAIAVGSLVVIWLAMLISRQAKQLALSQDLFRLATEGAGVGVWHRDVAGLNPFRSRELFAMLGYKPNDPICRSGSFFFDLAHPDDRERVRVFRENLRKLRDVVSTLELRMVCRDGEYRWFEATGTAVGWEGNEPVRLAGTLINIDARKRSQEGERATAVELERKVGERTRELAKANHEMETFSYSVSHDLRAPVRHVNAFARLCVEALDEDDLPRAREMLERVQRAGEHMDHVIADLLLLSRVVRTQPLSEPVDLSALARGTHEWLGTEEPAREVAVTIQPNLVVRGDPGLLRVVMENLMSNAWKFSRPKGNAARIDVGCERGPDGPAYFVRDNGVGFDPTRATRLFDPFVRLHSAQEFEGTGIGLATVRRAIERLGGTVHADSKLGEGTTIRFTLPS
ncbi:hypothetical protein BWI17_17755 [Betaproteobacteria bacterium GR16-43]|nr:hypothetical protein BWI17_17755 [Betaproteobacteria bacterium GR16-43]